MVKMIPVEAGDGSAVKSTGVIEPHVTPISTLGGSQLPVTPAPGDLITSSGLHGHLQSHACTHRHMFIYIVKKI